MPANPTHIRNVVKVLSGKIIEHAIKDNDRRIDALYTECVKHVPLSGVILHRGFALYPSRVTPVQARAMNTFPIPEEFDFEADLIVSSQKEVDKRRSKIEMHLTRVLNTAMPQQDMRDILPELVAQHIAWPDGMKRTRIPEDVTPVYPSLKGTMSALDDQIGFFEGMRITY